MFHERPTTLVSLLIDLGIGLSILLPALGIFFVTLWYHLKGDATFRWPTTQGRLIKYELKPVKQHGVDVVTPMLQYTYLINGVEFHGQRVQFGGSPVFLYEVDADLFLQYYGADEKGNLKVRYNPKNPSQSTFLPGADPKILEYLIGSAAFSLLALVCVGVGTARFFGVGWIPILVVVLWVLLLGLLNFGYWWLMSKGEGVEENLIV